MSPIQEQVLALEPTAWLFTLNATEHWIEYGPRKPNGAVGQTAHGIHRSAAAAWEAALPYFQARLWKGALEL